MTIILVDLAKDGILYETGFGPCCISMIRLIYPEMTKGYLLSIPGFSEMIQEVDQHSRALFRYKHDDGQVTFSSSFKKLKEEIGIA